MTIPFSDMTNWLPAPPWLAPVMGATACALAYLIGRRFLVSKPTTKGVDPDGPFEAHFLSGVTRDRRATPRRRGNVVEVELSFDLLQEPVRCLVLDRSIGGLGLLVDQPVPEGVVVKVRPRESGERTPWTDATIRSCRPDGSQYEVGLQFHRTPNWSLLLQFG